VEGLTIDTTDRARDAHFFISNRIFTSNNVSSNQFICLQANNTSFWSSSVREHPWLTPWFVNLEAGKKWLEFL
jgi:hypothetical protein